MANFPRIITGWKNIAKFFDVHIETVVRWHEEEGMPVSKIGGVVLASVNQLEKWVINNNTETPG